MLNNLSRIQETASKRAIEKTVEVTGDFIVNRIESQKDKQTKHQERQMKQIKH